MTMGKGPWGYFAVSMISIVLYVIVSVQNNVFNIGTLICILTVTIPMQLFLHLYFSSAVKSNNYVGIAGYDSGIEYNHVELKKQLVKIDHHIGMSSATYVMIMSLLGSGLAGENAWSEYLVFVYVIEFVSAIMILNYQSIDRIYMKDVDKERARAGFPVTIGYFLIAMAAVAVLMVVFIMRDISNNTIPALKLSGIFILGIIIATIGMLREDSMIKKWRPEDGKYRMSRFCKVCYGVATAGFLVMFFIK